METQIFKNVIIRDTDFIEKYMLETILHQQDIHKLLTEKKLLHTQEVQINIVQVSNVDSFVMEKTCPRKENSSSETALSKLVMESSLDSETKDVHAIKYKMSKAKERCMIYFQALHSHFQVLSNEDLKGTRIEHGFNRAFLSLFGQDDDTFISTMLLNVDQLKSNLTKTNFKKIDPWLPFGCLTGSFSNSLIHSLLWIMTAKWQTSTLLNTLESSGTESGKQKTSSRLGNDVDIDDVDIKPVYDEEPMAEVQLTAERNVFALGQYHTEQPEIINEGRVDQYPEQCQVKSPMLDSSPDNQTTDYSKQSLESENILLKKTVAQFQKDFSRMEAHCIALELKYQNQALKSGQHGQILNETSNKAKIKKEIDVLETMNIELEHSVAKLRKENETLKKHYKDLYDSIKITRSKTIEQTTSLLANNADLKAQIQEKVFAIAALKNDLRKLKGNSVDTKFAKTSVLEKPVLQSLRNQSVVRQPNAFKSERPQMSKPQFASQVDVNNNLSRPVTQHYFPKRSESAFSKPNHMIASSSSRNRSKNMPRFSSNNMVHNHYLEEAKKKTQEKVRNSKSSMMPSTSLQNNTDGSKPKPRSNNQTSRSLPKSKSSCETSNVVPLVDHSRNSRHRFSPNKTSVVYEKTPLRSDLRWKPTVIIFKTVSLRWVPTGKILASCTSIDDSEPTHGSNVDISTMHECKQTLDLSACSSINVQEEQSFDLSVGTSNNVKPENLRV
ncbi:hypothetical protein Tco_0864659 [Tanacetum coccineum]